MAFPLTTEPALCSCFRILLEDPILHHKKLLQFWEIGDQELENFRMKISQVQGFLNNAEERSQEICVSIWMDNLRELSYDLENHVDEMNRERDRMDQHVAIRNQARTTSHEYSYSDNIAVFWPQMKAMKKGINDASERLEKVLKGAKDLELKHQAAGRSPVSTTANRDEDDVGASVDESDVYGRQTDQDFVIQEYLLSSSHSSKNYSPISIVGMGGVGKTTLARLIFQDERVEKNFDVRSWACVSDVFDAEKVLKQLIEYVPGDSVSTTAPLALRPRFEDMVKGKKILIVLDDVWEVKAWNSLKLSFTHCAKGSKILVTTRDKSVGDEGDELKSYELEPLDDKDCLHLFKKKAFGKDVDKNLEQIGWEIVKKCKGVPLAVKVIGSTLRFASTERWENALRELWQSEDGASDEIFSALKLSYRYLPSYLKRCFGSLSLFPTDYWLKQDKVVMLWIAENFIESKEGRSLEDIGHEYYKELQRRCLIQEDERMHDLIHRLACSVSGKCSYRMANGNSSCMHVESVRHLSVIDKNMDLKAFDENKHLRTLFIFSGNFSEMICDQSLLFVLHVEGTTLQKLPNSVEHLKCLRYLDLSGNRNIECLPDSICKLQNLQTLNLQDCFGLRSLPNVIGDLKKLRYLCLDCTSLSDLPTTIGNLHNLRNLSIRYCSSLSNLPDEIGDLQDLMELNLCGTSITHMPKSIGNLHNVRKLNINGCKGLAQLPENIGNLVSLQELHLAENFISSLPDSICKLKKLRVLNLFHCESFSNLPDEIGALQDLMELNLCGTSISYLPKSIGNLNDLRNLNIDDCERLAQLPEDICNLSNLESFEFNKNLLPRGIGRLHNIKRFLEFVVGKEEGWGIEELNGMNKLKGQLTISHLENVDSVEKARMASLKSKIYINHLYFEWSSMDDACDGSEDDASDESEDDASDDSDLGGVGLTTRDGETEANVLEAPEDDASDDSNLGSVGLTTRDGETEANVLEALEPCPTRLLTLSFENYHGKGVPMWMGKLKFPYLKKLILDGLQCVESVMDVDLPSLKFLRIENCPKLMAVSMAIPKLQVLLVSSCQELKTLCMIPSLPYASEIRSLQEIYIINCPGLVPFLDKGLPPMLQKLEIASWKNLPVHLLRDLRHSTSLTSLEIEDCPELVSFPEGLSPRLQNLVIASCTNLQHLPSGLGQNTSLTSLHIYDCPELVYFPEEGLPPMLKYLEIASWKNLPHLLRVLGHSTSLMSLMIKDCPELVSFPDEGLPPMLEYLDIRNCTNLRHLPTGVRDLTSLKTLRLDSCPVLGVRSDDELPPNVRPVIVNCSILEQQRKDEDRKGWLTKSSFYDFESGSCRTTF